MTVRSLRSLLAFAAVGAVVATASAEPRYELKPLAIEGGLYVGGYLTSPNQPVKQKTLEAGF